MIVETQPRISLADLLEVRSDGLTASELFSVLSSACVFLTRIGNNDREENLFSLNQMFLTRDGRIEILFTNDLSKQFIPPEFSKQADQSEGQQNARESHLVWCLGMSCLRVIAAHSDVALFSLLNLMTVADAPSRPTLSKVTQMVRNQLGIVQLAKVQEVISNLFKEVMGDLDELLADPFDDDIRFSSSRSSKLSIIPGPGSPEQISSGANVHPQNALVAKVADRLQGELLLSQNSHSQSAANPFDELNMENQIDSVGIPEELQLGAKIAVCLPLQQQRKSHESSAEEDESTPRGTTPIPTSEQRDIGEQRNVITTDIEQSKVKSPLEARSGQNTQQLFEMEVHGPPMNLARGQVSLNSQQQQTQTQKPTGRLYAKVAQVGKVPRAVAKKEAEIEIMSQGTEGRFEDSLCLDSPDRTFVCEAAPLPVSGFSPVMRRKVQQDTDTDSQRINEQSEHFQRKNSLEPSRCSKRRESSGKKKALPYAKVAAALLPTVPEFLSTNVRPIFRLRAQSMKRKKVISLHRSDPAVVFVRLLNGHVVEVNCRTDTLVGSVFHTVAEHLDITEHLFFGLVLQRQFGENVFLEEHQRLEKWAPPGWKGTVGLRRSFGAGGTLSRQQSADRFVDGAGSKQFTLLLRFRYYPKKREFIKTTITAHQLYLQLRQDILSGTLRFSPKERAMEMAALALCVEAHTLANGDRADYFKLEDYLPTKFYGFEPNEVLQVQRQIAQMHRRLAVSFGYLEAEEQFISRCQAEPLYGAHFYRVHKIKPKRGYTMPSRPFLSDVRIIAIIPSGIGICREDRNGPQRLLNSTHEWHSIRTLQFDRKRFLLGTIEENIAVDHVFYTDHHSKASYLVRFAASQHRFMLKMRQWQGTLNRMHLGEWQRDVGVEQRKRSEEVVTEHQIGDLKDGRNTHARSTSHPQMGIGGLKLEEATSLPDHFSDHNRLMFETEREYIEYFYGSEAQRIDVLMEKDPLHGLGLTLIDGDMNGVKTVFVKSLSPEGEGRRKGLLVGDCLLSVNGVSLFNKSRHDAVQLVSSCARDVRLQLLRFPSVSEVLAQGSSPRTGTPSFEKKSVDRTDNTEKTQESDGASSICVTKRGHFSNASVKETQPVQSKTRGDDHLRKKESTVTTESKLSYSTSGDTPNSVSSTQKRQRAVSDFGALYLPALRTDDILALGPSVTSRMDEKPQRYRRHKTSTGFHEFNSMDSDSVSSDDDQNDKTKKVSDSQSARRGEYKPHLPPALSMYSFLGEDEEDTMGETNILSKSAANVHSSTDHRLHPTFGDCFSNGSHNAEKNSSGGDRSPFSSAVARFARVDNSTADALSWNTVKLSTKDDRHSKGLSLDWANCLSDVDGAVSSTPSSSPSSPGDRKQKSFTVRIAHVSSVDSLPFKLRTLPGKGIFVSEICKEKSPPSVILRVGDRIVAVDGMPLIECTWEQVVNEMIVGGLGKSELELTVERPVMGERSEGDEEQALVVTLDKAQNGTIGLSLAKRTGSDGVFIRNIAPDSIAAREGTLRVGDRIWSVQWEQIDVGESPANVVRRLKDLSGQFTIEVRRRRE